MSEIIHVEVEGLGHFAVPIEADGERSGSNQRHDDLLFQILSGMNALLEQQRQLISEWESMRVPQPDQATIVENERTPGRDRQVEKPGSQSRAAPVTITFAVRKVWVDRYRAGVRYRVVLPNDEKATTWDQAIGQRLVRAEARSDVITLTYRVNRRGHFDVVDIRSAAKGSVIQS